MEEKETRILPTVQDKWVSLHQSFGHICWCDDEQLRKEFMNADNIDFLFLGDLNNEEKQLLQDKVSVLFRRLGIPSLSEVLSLSLTHTHARAHTHTILKLTHLILKVAGWARLFKTGHPIEFKV